MKVALIGGGGFRAPLVWKALAGLPVTSIVLHDVDEYRLARIARVVDGMRARGADGPPVTTTIRLDEAVEGADFVFCAIRAGGLDGRVADETIPLEHGVLGQETVGPGGICFALRTLPAMRRIADEVAARAPRAWFLNFTNPAGLVTEALRPILGDRIVGICDSPTALCARVARALGRRMDELDFDYVGLNHLGWVLAVNDADRDLLPELLDDDDALGAVLEAQLVGVERVRAWRAIPNEYLVYHERPDDIVRSFTAAGSTRAQVLRDAVESFYAGADDALDAWTRARDARFGTYMAEARGGRVAGVDEAGAGDPGEAGYAAIASGFIRAASGQTSRRVIVDVPNRGRLDFLDDDAVIEAPCRISRRGIDHDGRGKELLTEQRELVERVKHVERTTIRASLEGSRALALEAVAAHPVVPSRDVAVAVLDGYLGAFPELAQALR